jgi:hypothetical protein
MKPGIGIDIEDKIDSVHKKEEYLTQRYENRDL